MNELSLYLLDIVQNSIKARSTNIVINITENIDENILTIEVIDDGCGMNEEVLSKVTDPFYTTRTTRKVGLGIPLFKELCEICLGNFFIESVPGKGTRLVGKMMYNSIDRPPFGDLVSTIYLLILNEEKCDIEYHHIVIKQEQKEFVLDTKELKQILGDVPFDQIDVMIWIKDYIGTGIKSIEEEL